MELSRCHFAESARRSFFVHPTNLIPPRYFSSGPFLDLDRKFLLYNVYSHRCSIIFNNCINYSCTFYKSARCELKRMEIDG